jgi:hypothetical protein
VALKKHMLENSTMSDAALARILQAKEPSLQKVSSSTIFLVRRYFEELIAQAEEREG